MAKLCSDVYEENPDIRGILLGQHGHTNWASKGKDCYDTSLWVIEKAARYIEDHDKGEMTFGGAKYEAVSELIRQEILNEFLPVARGLISDKVKFIATIQTDGKILRFVNSSNLDLKNTVKITQHIMKNSATIAPPPCATQARR